MNMALVAKNKICFVDGSIVQPSIDDSYYALWSRYNSMVMSWILHSVSKDIAESIMHLNNALDIWNDLHDRFHQGNSHRVFQINLSCAQILMMDHLPLINKVFSFVIQEERQRSLSLFNLSQPTIAVYGVSSSNYNSYRGKKDKPFCTHYGMLGHTVDKCYKIHGYPLRYKPKGKFTDSVKG
ncbi:hypothetical protein UlMin_024949 [Ulmus minor]